MNHTRHGDGIADHGSLGNARFHADRGKNALVFIGLAVILVDRISMFGLHTDNLWKCFDDSDLKKFDKSAHHRGDVAGIADGKDDNKVLCIKFKVLGDLVGVGFLSQNAPGVFGVQQGHGIAIRQRFHHFHTVIKHTRDLKNLRTTTQGLRQLLGGDFFMGQQNCRFDMRCQVGTIQGGRS